MAKLNSTEKIVLTVLEESPLARQDDYILFCRVCEKLTPDIMNYPFWLVLANHKLHKLPNWKTIERCRRKIQANRPDLANPKTVAKREKEEKEYRAYAIS